jgi:hypothetical protein
MKTLLNILLFFWTNIIPLLLALAFSVGIFFNLWKVQGLSFAVSLGIILPIAALLIYGLGKLLRKW